MSAPAVQYVTTRDEFRIAYTTSGKGYPFVVLPSYINHVQDVWTEGFSVANLLKDATERYQVVHYDSRGMGMSTRGLSEDLNLESYITDLEAVLDRLQLERVVLLGFGPVAFLATHYALQHPERVAALILIGPPHRWLSSVWEDLAHQDWEHFLSGMVSRAYSRDMARRVFEMFRRWAAQKDYEASMRVWRGAHPGESLRQLQIPTLVLWARGLRSNEEGATEFTQLLPNAQLVFLESGLPYGAPGEALAAIEPFLRGSGASPYAAEATADNGLSERELGVLQLVAAGRSNSEIAHELAISQHTVVRHVSNILAKTKSANRSGAVSFAHRHGLID